MTPDYCNRSRVALSRRRTLKRQERIHWHDQMRFETQDVHMDRFDLSRQGITSLAQVSDEIVHQVERDGDDEYALSFAQNRIIEVHDIGRFQHVRQLDLSSNKIVSLDGIQVLQRLESVNLSLNNLTSVDVLGKVPSLRVLNVSENSIVQLDGLRDHRELAVLDASFNNITKWPRFGDMITLEMCGIGGLGLHLPKLQSLSIEGNGVVNQLQRSGGKLEYLLANFFPSVSLDAGGGGDPMSRSKRQDFIVPRATLVAIQHALQQGNEETVTEFLRTGSAPQPTEPALPMTRKAVAAATIPSSRFKVEELALPQPSQPPIAPVPTAASDSNAPSNAGVSPTALSKASKMEMWKRIQEERKAEQDKEKDRLQREMLTEQLQTHENSVETGLAVSDEKMPSGDNVSGPQPSRASAPARAQRSDEAAVKPVPSQSLPPPPSAPIASSKVPIPQLLQRSKETGTAKKPHLSSVMEDLRGGASSSAVGMESQNLAGQVKALSEQVLTMRKYMKVWIKREQMVREAAVKRIQRCFRQALARRTIAQKRIARRRKWRVKYAFRHCSSCLLPEIRGSAAEQNRVAWHLHAQNLQRFVRGFLTRARLCEWKSLRCAAIRIQRVWRSFVAYRNEILGFSLVSLVRSSNKSHGAPPLRQLAARLVNAAAHFGGDVKQLQQVCVAQEQAMVQLWDSTARFRRLLDYRIEVAVIRTQSLWRGYRIRKNVVWMRSRAAKRDKEPVLSPVRTSKAIEHMQHTIDQQSKEISRLSAQVQALQTTVERLLSARSAG